MESINITQAEYKVIKAEWLPFLQGEKGYFENRGWLNKAAPKYSYSVLKSLMKKKVIERVEKKYHTYERIRYRFTDSFLAKPVVQVSRMPLVIFLPTKQELEASAAAKEDFDLQQY